MRNPSSFHVRRPLLLLEEELVGEPENRSESERPKCFNGAIIVDDDDDVVDGRCHLLMNMGSGRRYVNIESTTGRSMIPNNIVVNTHTHSLYCEGYASCIVSNNMLWD